MLKTAYIYPHNTPSIVNRGKIRRTICHHKEWECR